IALWTAACGASNPPPRSLDPNADVVIPYAVSGGGEVRFTVHPRYAVGEPVTLTLDIRSGTLRVRGPLSGRVLASELESSEQLVRTLGPAGLGGVDVAPGGTAHTTVTWDARNDEGMLVAARTYSLSLDFIVGEQPLRIGSVIEIRPR
ncbi:MAG TPA: hypothetical protein VGK15_04785, partial [Candidatus Limnocylindria bacterium]